VWKIVLTVSLGSILASSLTYAHWLPAIAHSLVCSPRLVPSDAILVEDVDTNYLLFEEAATLRRSGVSARVLVPIQAGEGNVDQASPVAKSIAELMGRLARLQNLEIVPITAIEPYTLNAARQVRAYLERERLGSIIIVAAAFRSKRSSLVYETVLGPSGIRVSCRPVFGNHTPENWSATWHGIQDVGQQLLKLQFYRFYVLRKPWS
jgi:hypothetical protein